MKYRGRGSIPVSQYRRMEFTEFTSLPSSLQLHRAVLGLLTWPGLTWGGNINIDWCMVYSHNLVTTTTLILSPLSSNIHFAYVNIFSLFKYYVSLKYGALLRIWKYS